jgi:large subunit ribosomal protein L21
VLVDLLAAAEGEKVELGRVLLINDGKKTTVGTPVVKGAKVVATAMGKEKGDKIVVFKYKPKVRYHHKTGHRQQYTRLNIQKITTRREAKQDGPQEGRRVSQE